MVTRDTIMSSSGGRGDGQQAWTQPGWSPPPAPDDDALREALAAIEGGLHGYAFLLEGFEDELRALNDARAYLVANSIAALRHTVYATMLDAIRVRNRLPPEPPPTVSRSEPSTRISPGWGHAGPLAGTRRRILLLSVLGTGTVVIVAADYLIASLFRMP